MAKPAPIARRLILQSSTALRTGDGARAAERPKTVPLPDRYELRETPSRKYAQRTEWNVRDSDATVVFSIAAEPQGGTRLTLALARQHLAKPVLHLSREVLTPEIAATKRSAVSFSSEHAVAYAQRRRAPGFAGTEIAEFVISALLGLLALSDVVCRAARAA